jgi:hypothetical protein
MNRSMERLQTRSISWRLYAVFVVLLLLLLVQRRPVIPGAGLNWEGAKAVYWSFALLGLVGYAYGFRFLSQTFWRVYALIFTVDITSRFVAKVGWVPVARLFGHPEESRHGTFTILLGLGFIAITCLALLRYGGWLKEPPGASSVAEGSSTIESSTVERMWPKDQRSSRYSLVQCAMASLAGAIFSAFVARMYFGQWNLAFAAIEFIVAFLALVCGGRSLANRLAARGKDTVLRGVAIGASLGALAAAFIAALFAAVLLGGTLSANPASLPAIGMLGVPFGLVNGAVVGAALILLGQRRSAKATENSATRY